MQHVVLTASSNCGTITKLIPAEEFTDAMEEPEWNGLAWFFPPEYRDPINLGQVEIIITSGDYHAIEPLLADSFTSGE